jgi:hypothetical protein
VTQWIQDVSGQTFGRAKLGQQVYEVLEGMIEAISLQGAMEKPPSKEQDAA